MGFLMCDNFSSNTFTVSITGKACLAHDGHEIIFTPLDLIPKDLRISNPAFTSSTGSDDR